MNEASPLATAVSWTIRAVHHRKVGFRWLVVAFAATLLSVPPMAVAVDWSVLSTALLLFPFWCVYLLADGLALRTWRQRVLTSWLAGEINLGVLRQAIGTLPGLPPATIFAMMRTLPIVEPERDAILSRVQRDVLAALSDLRWMQETTNALLPNIAAALAALCLLPVLVCPWVRLSAALMVGAALIAVAWVLQRLLVIVYRYLQRSWLDYDVDILRDSSSQIAGRVRMDGSDQDQIAGDEGPPHPPRNNPGV
jgi:hypothetical protein